MGIQRFIYNILDFVNDTLVPFMFAIAFVYFIWNLANLFIFSRDSEKAREEGSRNALYGILAFVVIISLWGIVNLFVVGLGFNQENALVPDYVCAETGNCTSTGGGGIGSTFGDSFNDTVSSGGNSCNLGIFCSFNDRGVRTCEWCAVSN